jgi:hypothetical protein
MNRNFTIILTLLAATSAGSIMAAGTTNTLAAKPAPVKADARVDFQSFKLITERNIFDMSRSGRVGRPTPVHIAKVDDFSLVGIMAYEKGLYAFFDGSSSEYQKTLAPLQTIADYKVTVIGPDYVELQSTNSQMVKMLVGTTIRREDKGPWSPPSTRNTPVFADSGSSRSRDRGDRSSRSGRSDRRQRGSGADGAMPATMEQTADATPAGGSDEDVIKRLMQKRAKEVKDD